MVYGADRPAPAAGDLGRDPVRRPGADSGPTSAHPRTGSPAWPELVEFLPSPIYGPTPSTLAAESAAHGTEARRPARPPWGLPRPVAGRAGGRGRGSRPGGLPALRAAVDEDGGGASASALAATGG